MTPSDAAYTTKTNTNREEIAVKKSLPLKLTTFHPKENQSLTKLPPQPPPPPPPWTKRTQPVTSVRNELLSFTTIPQSIDKHHHHNHHSNSGILTKTSSSSNRNTTRLDVLKSTRTTISLETTNADHYQESPDSPRKGSLKKHNTTSNGHRDPSLPSTNKSPLKVRWKDMIEISNVIDDDDDYDDDDDDNKISNAKRKQQRKCNSNKTVEYDEDVNYLDEYDGDEVEDGSENEEDDDSNNSDELEENSEEDEEEEEEYDNEDVLREFFQEEDLDSNDSNETEENNVNQVENKVYFNRSDRLRPEIKIKKCKRPIPQQRKAQQQQQQQSKDIIISTEKKNYHRRGETGHKTTHQFNLKPLHSTGKQFEKEMSARIDKLNKIKSKDESSVTPGHVKLDNEKFYDEIHADMDGILYELHSTIEHVRISSMISNIPYAMEDEEETTSSSSVTINGGLDEHAENNSNDGATYIATLLRKGIEEKIADVAVICRQFVNNAKSMISSALINEHKLRANIRIALNSLCALVVQCFETTYKYLYRNEKLDEARQLLIQVLNLINTFRNTLNITYLASAKQLNDASMNLLMKQATNLANEISLLIKHFKLLF